MQVNSIISPQNIQKKQNFKGCSASTGAFASVQSVPDYQSSPLNISRAYASPQFIQGYKEIQTFDVPYVGKGKMYELTNGHKLVVIPKPGPFVINTYVKAGQEEDLVASHFVEHLIYNAKNQIDGKTFADFQTELGIDMKAETAGYHTNYCMKYPFNEPDNIEKIIKTQAQFIQYPQNFQTRMEKEKGVLVSEATIRPNEEKNYESASLQYLMTNELFGIDEKQKQRINEIEKIKNTTLEELTDFHKKYYDNNNMVSVIVGEVNPGEIAKSFAKHFNKPNNSAHGNKKQDLSKLIQQTKRFDIKLNSKIDQNIWVGFVGPKNNSVEENFLYTAFRTYYDEANKDKGFSFGGVSTEHSSVQNSITSFFAKVKPGQEEQKLKELYQNIFGLTQKPISDKELETLKIKLKESFSSMNEGAIPIAIISGDELVDYGNLGHFEYSKLVDKMTKEDLQTFAKKYFDLNKAVVIVTHENEKTNKSNQPAFTGSKATLDTSNIVEYKYPGNNLQLVVDKSPAIAKTSFKLEFTPDSNQKIKPGVAKALGFMLVNAQNDYKTKYPYISEPKFVIRPDKISIETTSLPEYTQNTICLIKSSILSPNLNQKTLDEVKKWIKKEYELESDNFSRKIRQQKFYGSANRDPILETYSYEEACKLVDDITLLDVIAFHKKLTSNVQGKAILVVPNGLFETQKKEIFYSIGTGIPMLQPKQKNDLASKTPVKSISKSKVITNEIKGSNAKLQQDFQIELSGDLSESLGVQLISSMLGEQRDSRLESEVREKQGLSYTTGTLLEIGNRPGYLSLISKLPLDKNNAMSLQKVLEIFKRNINDLVNIPIGKDELKKAKTTFKSNIIQALEYSSSRTELLDKYGIDDTRVLFQTLDKMTPIDVQKIAKKVLDKPCLTFVSANKDVLDKNKAYLSAIGELI